MSVTPIELQGEELARIRALAESLDCILDEDLQLLGGVKGTTTEAWRKRGRGPGYIVFGNRVLYPRKAVASFLQAQTRERTLTSTRGEL